MPHRRWDWAETRQVLFVSETGVTGCLLRKQHPVKRMWTVTSRKETDDFWSSRRSSGGELRTGEQTAFYARPPDSTGCTEALPNRGIGSVRRFWKVSNYLGSFLRGYCYFLMLALNSGPTESSIPLDDFFFLCCYIKFHYCWEGKRQKTPLITSFLLLHILRWYFSSYECKQVATLPATYLLYLCIQV